MAWADPFCGAEYPGPDGIPVICGRDRHDDSTRHRHEESGFSWWTFQTYPRS
jgi:hypothetical protein